MFLYVWSAVQIIGEMIPISSSGHLQLFERFFSPDHLPLMIEPYKTYLGYLLHLPTAIVLPLFFLRSWTAPFRHITSCWPLVLKISFFTFCADVITVLFYLSFKAAGGVLLPLWLGFCITGISLLSLRWCPTQPITIWSFDKALLLGLVQAIAFIPGISRFATTFVAARWQGLSARRSFQISFLIQWPLVVIASVYSLNFFCRNNLLKLLNPLFWCVMLIVSIIAYGVLYGIGQMITRELLWLWGIYMMVPCIISFLV